MPYHFVGFAKSGHGRRNRDDLLLIAKEDTLGRTLQDLSLA